MSDLVINHCSSKNQLFQNFLNKLDPGSEFFISSTKNFNNFSKVVRPRSSKLSKKLKFLVKIILCGVHLVMIKLILILKIPMYYYIF